MKQLTRTMQAALDQLTGTRNGKLGNGQGVGLSTARALAARGLVHLEEADGVWVMVAIEPEVQEIADADLEDMDTVEAELLRPLDPRRRYRALRHAHIVSRADAARDHAAGYPQLAQTRAEALRQAIPPMLRWAASAPGATEFLDLAGRQWKFAREHVLDTWYIGTGRGEAVIVVHGANRKEAHAAADKIIAADPVGYRELVKGYGSRRITLGQYVADRRAGKITGAL